MEAVLYHIFEFFAASTVPLYYLAFAVAVFILLSGIDELTFDISYWFLRFVRPQKLNPQEYELPEDLDGDEQKSIAVFIPAWHEHEVIDKMLTRACETIDYGHYDIFVGVYPNDPATIEKVRSIAARYPQVHPIIGSHDGPSTKAENLNEMHTGMMEYENLTGIRYHIIVMHDSEDVIHPLSLKIHNHYIPRYDMVQLPVFPLPVPHSDFVHWTYADEFAENHTKDLVARALVTDFVPSAGVGTGYNRWLIEFVGTSFARNIFQKASLTEDYEISLRLALGKARMVFLYNAMKLQIGTRAYFPNTLKTAIRQKTRWLIGICLQSWKRIGWIGDWTFRVALYHDRKAVVTNVINILAYCVLVYILLYELARWGLSTYGTLPAIINPGTLLYTIVAIDTGLMLWRFLNRFVTVRRIYGTAAGFLSIIRLPVGNFINFAASVRGTYQFFRSQSRKEEVRWDKTRHVAFPEWKSDKESVTTGPIV